MFRLAYRNFGDHESLVVNHTVAGGALAGVRWYEIRNPVPVRLSSSKAQWWIRISIFGWAASQWITLAILLWDSVPRAPVWTRVSSWWAAFRETSHFFRGSYIDVNGASRLFCPKSNAGPFGGP